MMSRGAPEVPGVEYERVTAFDLHVGDEVIVECLRFDYKKGFPIDSDYYRTIAGEHRTVAGMAFHLANEPNIDFPRIAPWQGRWIYAGNNGATQMWRKRG